MVLQALDPIASIGAMVLSADSGRGRGGHAGSSEDPQWCPPPLPAPPAREHETSSSSSSSSSSFTSHGSSGNVVVARSRSHLWIELPDGGTLRLDEYKQRKKRKQKYFRLILKCPHCSSEDKCSKKRNISKANCSVHGALEAVAFLMVWRDQGTHEDVEHNMRNPATDVVRNWCIEHPTFCVENGIVVQDP